MDVWLQKWNRTCPLCKKTIKRQGKPLFTDDQESSRLLTESGAPSVHIEEGGVTQRDGATGGPSGYGATDQTSPLRSLAAGHRRSASSTSSNSQRSSLRRSLSRPEPAVTTIELNVTSGESSRSTSHSPSPEHFHTPRQSDEDGEGKSPSFETADGNESGTSSVRA